VLLFHQPRSIAQLQLHLQNVKIFELPAEIRHLQCFIFGVGGNLRADYRQTKSRARCSHRRGSNFPREEKTSSLVSRNFFNMYKRRQTTKMQPSQKKRGGLTCPSPLVTMRRRHNPFCPFTHKSRKHFKKYGTQLPRSHRWHWSKE